MVRLTRYFFLAALAGVFCFSIVSYFTDMRRRVPRVLLYRHLVNKRIQGVRLGFARHKINSDDSIADLVSVAIRRPPVVFFRPLFSGTAELQNVQINQNNVYINLTVKDSARVDPEDLKFLKKIVRTNFPIFREIQIFVNGRLAETS